MSTTAKAFAASFVRHLLTVLATWLAGKGILSPEHESGFIEIGLAVALALIVMLWSWLQKKLTVGGSAGSASPTPKSLTPKSLSAVLLLICAGGLLVGNVGCQNVGPTWEQNPAETISQTPAPNRSGMTDAEGTWAAEGSGPATVASVDADGVTISKGGSPTRQILYSRPDGTKVVVSSDTDIEAEGVEVDPETNQLKIKRFATSTSEPQRALNEGYAILVGYWTALSADQREARIAELKAMEAAGDAFAGVLAKVLTGL